MWHLRQSTWQPRDSQVAHASIGKLTSESYDRSIASQDSSGSIGVNGHTICEPEVHLVDIIEELISIGRTLVFTHLVIAICEDSCHN